MTWGSVGKVPTQYAGDSRFKSQNHINKIWDTMMQAYNPHISEDTEG